MMSFSTVLTPPVNVAIDDVLEAFRHLLVRQALDERDVEWMRGRSSTTITREYVV